MTDEAREAGDISISQLDALVVPADALGGLPDAAQSAADSQVNATNEAIKDHATTAIATARQQLDKGVAALSAAAQAATDKATSLLPPK